MSDVVGHIRGLSLPTDRPRLSLALPAGSTATVMTSRELPPGEMRVYEPLSDTGGEERLTCLVFPDTYWVSPNERPHGKPCTFVVVVPATGTAIDVQVPDGVSLHDQRIEH